MNFTDEALRILSWRMCGDSTAITSRDQMEAMLLTMIRVALRTGRGRPEVVRWVTNSLRAMTPSANADPQGAAPRMARLLCSRMLQHIRAEPARIGAWETVVGL